MTWLPDAIGPGVFAALTGVSFLTSLMTVTFGIGGGALLLAVMASLVPPAALIPVHGVVQLGSNVGRLGLMLRHVAWGAVPAFAVGSILGAAVGGAIVVELPAKVIQAGVGVFVIWSVLARPPAWLNRWPAVTGAFSTFLTMFFGATGVFVATYVKSLMLERHGHVATHAALMSGQHALKVVVFGVLGFAFAPWLGLVAAMLAAGFAGTWIGRSLLGRMSEGRFRLALNVVLVLIALRLICASVVG